MGVLDELIAASRARARQLGEPPPGRPCTPGGFRSAIAGRGRIDIIAEFKRSSPSQGRIRTDSPAAPRATDYVGGGARAISVLTEPTRFHGSYDDLQAVAATVSVPVLMKDFVVSPRQVEFAAALGAAAVLLIVRCLPGRQLDELVDACRAAGVEMLIECHDAAEIERALAFEDAVIGVNHRNLATLEIDLARGRELLATVPTDRVVVSESGIETPDQVRGLTGLADAVLIGTALMRAGDPRRFLVEALA